LTLNFWRITLVEKLNGRDITQDTLSGVDKLPRPSYALLFIQSTQKHNLIQKAPTMELNIQKQNSKLR
jgi:hypothetical protein